MATGFPPIAAVGVDTLVLGSLPSVRSLQLGQYYAHPRNAFWPIMGKLIGAGLDQPYDERVRRLIAAGIAVWDVLERSHRPGSLDADIDMASASVNDFAVFFSRAPAFEARVLQRQKGRGDIRFALRLTCAGIRTFCDAAIDESGVRGYGVYGETRALAGRHAKVARMRYGWLR